MLLMASRDELRPPPKRPHLSYGAAAAPAAGLTENGVELLLKALESLLAKSTEREMLDILPSMFVTHLADFAILASASSDGRKIRIVTAESSRETLALASGSVPAAWPMPHSESAQLAASAPHAESVSASRMAGTLLHDITQGEHETALNLAIDAGKLTADYGEQLAERILALGCGSAITVPVRRAGQSDAALALFSGPRRSRYTSHDLALFSMLAERLSSLLDLSGVASANRELALAVQQTFVPAPKPVRGMDIAVAYLPATRGQAVGGDWYDIYELPNGATSITVGDVMGHNANAAVYMGQITAAMRAYSWMLEGPSRTIERTDQLMRGVNRGEIITTCIALEFTPLPEGGLRALGCRAGHPPPVVRVPDGTTELLYGRGSTPIGVPYPGGERPCAAVDLAPGSLVVMFTDGLIERRDVALADRLEELRLMISEMAPLLPVELVKSRLLQHFASGPLSDDVCLVVIRVD